MLPFKKFIYVDEGARICAAQKSIASSSQPSAIVPLPNPNP